jgi:hypothetical protein
MSVNRLTLTNHWISYLMSIPEKGMGYHLVKVFLKNGKVLPKHKVLNSSILILEPNENISVDDIDEIQPEK